MVRAANERRPFAEESVADVQALDTAQLIALAPVLGFASGVRRYAVLFVVGLTLWLPPKAFRFVRSAFGCVFRIAESR